MRLKPPLMKAFYSFLTFILLSVTAICAERDGNRERELFMHSIMFTFDAFADATPESEMSPLLAKAIAEGEKVNLEFLDFLSPGLGMAWAEFYLASHRLRIEGRRKNAAGDEKNGAVDQLRAIVLWKKWHEFWDIRRDGVYKKLKVDGF